MSEPLVLGIETSCDETGVGIVRGNTLLAGYVQELAKVSVEYDLEFARAIVESNRRRRDSLIQNIAMWRQMAADPGIDAKQAAELRLRADQYERRVAQLEVDILEQERDAGDR